MNFHSTKKMTYHSPYDNECSLLYERRFLFLRIFYQNFDVFKPKQLAITAKVATIHIQVSDMTQYRDTQNFKKPPKQIQCAYSN